MKRLKIFSTAIAIAAISASLHTAPVFSAEGTSTIGLNLLNASTSTSTNNLSSTFEVTNKGNEKINLANLKIRYYYTVDSNQDQNFNCYYATIKNPYKVITTNVTGKFVKMDNPTKNADTYCEISFSSDAGELNPGESVSVQTSINKKDWSNYDQSNDYSFNNSGNVVVYVNNKIASGTEPTTTPQITDAVLDKNQVELQKDNLSDIIINMTLNNNTFNGIDGLTKDKDYTVSNNKVTIAKAYLATLPVGDKNLNFDFTPGNQQSLKITIKDSSETQDLIAGIGQVEAKAGDTVTVPVTLKGVPQAGIADFGYRVKYDPTVVDVVSVKPGKGITNPDNNFVSKILPDKNIISILFIDSALNDTETIKGEGELAQITFKVKANAKQGASTIEFNNDDHSFYDINGNELKVQFANGGITVK